MMWIVIFHLACLAVALEFMYRAPEYDEEGRVVQQPRRLRRAAAPPHRSRATPSQVTAEGSIKP